MIYSKYFVEFRLNFLQIKKITCKYFETKMDREICFCVFKSELYDIHLALAQKFPKNKHFLPQMRIRTYVSEGRKC